MSEEEHTPQHAAGDAGPAEPGHPTRPAPGGRWSAPRTRVAVVAGVVVMLVAAGVGMSSALSEPDDDTEASGTTVTTERPTTTTTEATTTTARPPRRRAPETTTTLPPETTTTLPPAPEADGTLELGESGDAVAALQQRLVDLGYWMGEPDGTYGQLTRQAVMAFQKVEGLGRDGVAGPATQAQLAAAGRPAPRGGDGIEIDLERQVIFIVQGGQVQWALNTSTGNGEAYTSSTGRVGPGRDAAGRASTSSARSTASARRRSAPCTGRSTSTAASPCTARAASRPRPASHGCARVTNSAMDMIWASGAMAMGTPVTVY